MGVSLFPDNSGDAAALIKNADTAMYSAKQAGKNGYRFFTAPNGAPAPTSALARAPARPRPPEARRATPSSPEGE
jgi:predicted signal transduction protein with EAL and GGDEF domain